MASTPNSTDMLPEYSDSRTLLTRTAPLTASALVGSDLSPDNITCVEMMPRDELYRLITAYVVKTASPKSFVSGIGNSKSDDADGPEESRVVDLGLGLGLFPFTWDGHSLWALHQTVGEVVGTDCGAALMRTLCLIAPGTGESHIGVLQAFAQHLVNEADRTTSKTFTIWRYVVQHEYWRHAEVVRARDMDSVVLPTKTKDRVVEDLDDFVARGTRAWYTEHGIPYKRAYLLHGSPGAGKTSLIQAIAGRYGRNLAYLSPSHPDMTDDGLKTAVQRCPAKSIIVLEDVDALFGEGRKKKEGDKSALTFSGLLNALDGVGSCSGSIFILTTNHRERLDPALIRNGRVDMHVEFTDATDEQMRGLFLAFYKGAPPALAEEFATKLRAELGEKTVSMAALQHFFIMMRKRTPSEAVEQVGKVVEEMEERKPTAGETKGEEGGKEAKDTTKAEKGGKEEASGSDGAEKAKGKKGAKGGSTGGRAVHVHVHLHGGDGDEE